MGQIHLVPASCCGLLGFEVAREHCHLTPKLCDTWCVGFEQGQRHCVRSGSRQEAGIGDACVVLGGAAWHVSHGCPNPLVCAARSWYAGARPGLPAAARPNFNGLRGRHAAGTHAPSKAVTPWVVFMLSHSLDQEHCRSQGACCDCDELSPTGWIAVILLILFFWPLAWVPCVMSDCYEQYQRPVYGWPSQPPGPAHTHRLSRLHSGAPASRHRSTLVVHCKWLLII